MHHVNAQIAPRQFRRIAFGEHLDAISVHDHVTAVHGHFAREAAVSGVVACQVRVGLGVTEIVDRDDLNLIGAAALVQRAKDVATDASVSVDGDFDRHGILVLMVGFEVEFIV